MKITSHSWQGSGTPGVGYLTFVLEDGTEETYVVPQYLSSRLLSGWLYKYPEGKRLYVMRNWIRKRVARHTTEEART